MHVEVESIEGCSFRLFIDYLVHHEIGHYVKSVH